MSARKPLIVAIDGPAGAGKSTVARLVAEALHFRTIDTGAMYRAIAWKALQEGVPLTRPRALQRLAQSTALVFKATAEGQHVILDGKDVSHRIRSQAVSQATRVVAALAPVRSVLRQRQQEMGRRGRVVMEGRDIGTEVFPRARFKFFLDASPLERARRRFNEIKAKHPRATLKRVAAAIRRRDHRDRTRTVSPLYPAADAVHLDTTALSPREVTRLIVEIVRQGRP